MELQLLGVKVSVIRPGAVKTGLLKNSTDELDEFCSRTRIYTYNAKRFKKIVDSVEAKNVTPNKVAKKAFKAINAKRPKYLYNLNRNPLLRILNVLPRRLQTAIIKGILKENKKA
jgi:short-subunit dehydrogenase